MSSTTTSLEFAKTAATLAALLERRQEPVAGDLRTLALDLQKEFQVWAPGYPDYPTRVKQMQALADLQQQIMTLVEG